MRSNKLIYSKTNIGNDGKTYCFFGDSYGRMYVYINGEIPVNGAFEIEEDGCKLTIHCKNGMIHREEGPAIISDSDKVYMFFGQRVEIEDLCGLYNKGEFPISLMAEVIAKNEKV